MLTSPTIVTLYVSEQDRSLALYTKNLGLEKGADNPTPEGRFLTVAPNNKSVQILLYDVFGVGQRAEESVGEIGQLTPLAHDRAQARIERVMSWPGLGAHRGENSLGRNSLTNSAKQRTRL